MSKNKVYVENFSPQVVSMFKKNNYEVVEDFFSADLLCLTGNPDVSPEIYKAKNTSSYSCFSTDVKTFGLMAIAHRVGMRMCGICRGGQALNVFHGGEMAQHISGHGISEGSHTLKALGQDWVVSTDHHQMMIPSPAARMVSCKNCVTEIIVHNNFDVSVQFHPEYGFSNTNDEVLFFKLLKIQEFKDAKSLLLS